ncbi:hypothetical protein EMIT0P253_40089 [Pseudomonas sp. IT-P253]
MTGTPIPVNTAKWPFISRVTLIYLAWSQFKQTFVLDAESGVDIMRHPKRKVVHRLSSPPLAQGFMDATSNLQLEKKLLSLE